MSDLKFFSFQENDFKVTEFLRLRDELVPDSGPAGTLNGELIRAAIRLEYDFYNNGMLNNTSGAVKFLMNYLPSTPDLTSALSFVAGFCNTGRYCPAQDDNELSGAIYTIMEATADFVNGRDNVPCDVDMFDLQEPEPPMWDDDEDEDEYEDEDD